MINNNCVLELLDTPKERERKKNKKREKIYNIIITRIVIGRQCDKNVLIF